MRRSLRYMALGVLTASLLSGNALTALADQDVNHGPGVSQAPEVSQEAPGVSGDTTQNGPGIIVEPGSGTAGRNHPSLKLPLRKRKPQLQKQEQRDRPQAKQPDRLRKSPRRKAPRFLPIRPFYRCSFSVRI
ncbi:MAG: hypothetical protein ACLVIR_01415 [Clostridium sp.]